MQPTTPDIATMQPRAATPGDAPELVRLRRLMFASMAVDTDSPGWLEAAEAHLRGVLRGDDVVAVVVDADDGRLAASGVMEFQSRIPSPLNPSGRVAYVGTMSTDIQWRRRGLARAVLSRLLAEARRRGVPRVELHATAQGAGLYESFGFVVRGGGLEMRLDPQFHLGQRPPPYRGP